MQSSLGEEVTRTLSKAACLVLFKLLNASYEVWRKENPDDVSASPMTVEATDQSQRISFWKLEGRLERTLPQVFSSNYEQLLAESRRLLTQQAG